MSYSLMGYFVIPKKKKVVLKGNLDFLKVLNARRYSSEFEDIYATGESSINDYPEISEQYYKKFVGAYSKDILKDENFTSVAKEFKSDQEQGILYMLDPDVFDNIRDDISKYIRTYPFKDGEEDLINVFTKVKDNVNGAWYKLSDFLNALEKVKADYEKYKDTTKKLESIKYTKDWFDMSSDAKDNYYEDLKWAEEDLETEEAKLDSLTKIINIMSFLDSETFETYTDEIGITRFDFHSWESQELEVFVEVC